MLYVNPTRSEREMYDKAPDELWGEEGTDEEKDEEVNEEEGINVSRD